MGLSREDFLTYCYVYCLLAQRSVQGSKKELDQQNIAKFFLGLWRWKDHIGKYTSPTSLADAGYDPKLQALWIRRREIPSVAETKSASFVNDGRTLSTATFAPFEPRHRLVSPDNPPTVLPLGLLGKKLINDGRGVGMTLVGDTHPFRGAVVHGLEDRNLWLGIRDDQPLYDLLEKAARESRDILKKRFSSSFPAARRAAWIRHEDPLSLATGKRSASATHGGFDKASQHAASAPMDAQAHNDFGIAGFVGVLPGRADLRAIMEHLPDSTICVRILAGSGEHNITGKGLDRLLELSTKPEKETDSLQPRTPTKVQILILNPESRFTRMRDLEEPRWGKGGTHGRVKYSVQPVKESLRQSARRHDFEIREYDRWMNWRLVFIHDPVAGDLAYASHYPPNGSADRVPVKVFKRDAEQLSLYWPLLKEFLDRWHYARKTNGKRSVPAFAEVLDELIGK